MARGKLTKEVKQLSSKLFGYEITVKGLRLLPYIMYCLMDNCNIDPIHINSDDRAVLMKWKKEGRLFDPLSNLTVSSDFYDTICEMLRVGYCSEMISD